MSDWQMVILILLAIACGAAMAWMITDYVAEKRITRQERELSTLRSALEINDLVVRGRAQMVDEVLRQKGGAPPS